MAKTYTNPLPTASTGTVLTASNYNNLITDVNNLVVPPMIKAQPNTSGTLGTSTGTVLRFDVASATNPGTQTGGGFTTDPTLTAGTSALITINTAGVYLITLSAVISWTGTLTAYGFYINQTISGGTTQACSASQTGVALTSGGVFNVTGIASLGVGDSLQAIFSWAGATSPVYGATDSRNYMSAMFVGRTA